MLLGLSSAARIVLEASVCRSVFPSVSVTSVRWKHMKTRVVKAHVTGKVVSMVNSKPLPAVRKEAERLRKRIAVDGDDEDEDPEETLGNLDKVYDAVADEERDHRRRVRNILMQKEEDPQPPESNLLYWAAKQQILYLHRRDPEDWTPDRIAEEFPISSLGAKKLLKSKFLIDNEKIAAHDAEVDLRWKLLRKIKNSGICPEEGPVSLHKRTIELYLEDKLQNEAFKSGNSEFPRPAENAGIRVPVRVGHEGEHFHMLQEYRVLHSSGQNQPEDEETPKEEIVIEHPSEKRPSRSEKLEKALSRRILREDYGNDPEAATRLDLPENFRMAFVNEFSGRGCINLDQFKKIAGHEEPPQLESSATHVAKKPRKKDLTKLDRDLPKPPMFIKPPRAAVAEERFNDGTYRIGKTVFDADGQALYRLL